MDSSKEQEFVRQKEHKSLLVELKRDLENYDIWISTGSNSGSLPGFALERGLVPTGWMLSGQSKAVPYSGELSKGMGERGINQRAISFDSPEGTQSEALRYARSEGFNQRGWTPEVGIKNKEQLLTYLNESEDQHMKDYYNLQILITKRRLEQWSNLSPQERLFISDPFPVIYGINDQYRQLLRPKVQKLNPHASEEVFIEGKVDAENLTLFCPREKILEVKEYLKGKQLQGVKVLPFEVFSFLVDLWLWHLPPDSEWRQLTYNEQKHREEKIWWEFNKRFPTIHSYVDALRRWVAKSSVPI